MKLPKVLWPLLLFINFQCCICWEVFGSKELAAITTFYLYDRLKDGLIADSDEKFDMLLRSNFDETSLDLLEDYAYNHIKLCRQKFDCFFLKSSSIFKIARRVRTAILNFLQSSDDLDGISSAIASQYCLLEIPLKISKQLKLASVAIISFSNLMKWKEPIQTTFLIVEDTKEDYGPSQEILIQSEHIILDSTLVNCFPFDFGSIYIKEFDAYVLSLSCAPFNHVFINWFEQTPLLISKIIQFKHIKSLTVLGTEKVKLFKGKINIMGEFQLTLPTACIESSPPSLREYLEKYDSFFGLRNILHSLFPTKESNETNLLSKEQEIFLTSNIVKLFIEFVKKLTKQSVLDIDQVRKFSHGYFKNCYTYLIENLHHVLFFLGEYEILRLLCRNEENVIRQSLRISDPFFPVNDIYRILMEKLRLSESIVHESMDDDYHLALAEPLLLAQGQLKYLDHKKVQIDLFDAVCVVECEALLVDITPKHNGQSLQEKLEEAWGNIREKTSYEDFHVQLKRISGDHSPLFGISAVQTFEFISERQEITASYLALETGSREVMELINVFKKTLVCLKLYWFPFQSYDFAIFTDLIMDCPNLTRLDFDADLTFWEYFMETLLQKGSRSNFDCRIWIIDLISWGLKKDNSLLYDNGLLTGIRIKNRSFSINCINSSHAIMNFKSIPLQYSVKGIFTEDE